MNDPTKLPPLSCSQGGFAYNREHIDYWQRRAEKAEAERAHWQPIETARDTDGRILVIGGQYKIPTIVLSDASWWHHAKLKSTPTHWQPLPSPPETRQN